MAKKKDEKDKKSDKKTEKKIEKKPPKAPVKKAAARDEEPTLPTPSVFAKALAAGRRRAAAASASAPEPQPEAPEAADTPPSSAELEAELSRKSEKLADIRRRLRAIEAEIADEAETRSPFAPDAFATLPAIDGVRMAAVEAAVRYEGRLDVALFAVAEGARIAGVFTKSKTRAAPVLWCQERLAALQKSADAGPLAIIVNAGNANAFTGDNGRAGVEATASGVASSLKLTQGSVFVASTGVIGEPLEPKRITNKLSELKKTLSPSGWEDAARAIMTTDTYPKGASATVEIDGAPVSVAGVAKGAGMIAPDMATMLSFIFTDADVSPAVLQRTLTELCEESFNAITIDGDTSTSDTVLLVSTGRAGARRIESARSEGYQAFRRGLARVMRSLSHQVVKDGEGLTKFVEVVVEGAKTKRAAKRIAMSIANSPLVKTAWAGQDPNWGRIVMAVGKSGEEADRDAMSIRYGPHLVAENGWRAPGYDEADVAKYMREPELTVTVNVGVGGAAATVWTCDLTHDYVSINADYRS